jgi:hypothetical protein
MHTAKFCLYLDSVVAWSYKTGCSQQVHNINTTWRPSRFCTNDQGIIKNCETPRFCGGMFTTERYMTWHFESLSCRIGPSLTLRFSCRPQRAWSHCKQKADSYRKLIALPYFSSRTLSSVPYKISFNYQVHTRSLLLFKCPLYPIKQDGTWFPEAVLKLGEKNSLALHESSYHSLVNL